MKYRSKKGFTLAELLIVVAIIAVLVAVSIPIFNGQLEKARRAVDMQNARIIKSALTNAYNEGRMDIPKKAVGQEKYLPFLHCSTGARLENHFRNLLVS